MRIVLADPPAKERLYDASYPNLGILYLIGYLRAKLKDEDVKIFYLEADRNLRQHIDFVRSVSPSLYGLSFASKTSSLSYATLKAVKTQFPRLLTVCGGTHPTALPEEVMQKCPVDICVIGEGEETLLKIVKRCLPGETDFSSVEGIALRHNGAIMQTKRRSFVEDIDTIPIPAWDLVDFSKYRGMHLKKQPVQALLLVSRGCPYNCVFCSNPIWKSNRPWLRSRSARNITEEILLLYNLGVREIYMCSDELNFDEEWTLELLAQISELGLKDLFFQCNLRVDKVSERIAKALKHANVWLAHVGIESANDRVLNGLGKHITVDQVRKSTKLLSGHGVKVFGFVMLYNAWEEKGRLCYETTKEVDRTIAFCHELLKRGQIHYMSWQFCTPMPGARLYQIALRHGLFEGDTEFVWQMFDEHYPVMTLPRIDKRTMLRRIKKGVLLKDYFMLRSGAINWRHLWRVKENLTALLRWK